MKILIAPDSFKGNLTALEVAERIEKGIMNISSDFDIFKLPMADGGEGTVQSLVDATDGKFINKKVTGPLGSAVEAYFGLLGDGKTAVIEMATASGLPLIPADKKDPRKTTTYGTGELIKAALDEDIEEIIIGIGGSATNDAGVGMAQALGVCFLDSGGCEIGFGGGQLKKIESIDMKGLDPRIKDVKINVACDVTNPLYGSEGAAYIYGPQKGATPEMVEVLDSNLRYFSKIVKKELNIDVQSIPGAGAAGGLGAGLVAFLDGELRPGIEIVLEVNNFDEKVRDADLVITGEGKLDGQTVNGKTPIGVAKAAKKYNIPVVAIGGTIDDDADLILNEGIDAYFSALDKPVSLEEAIRRGGDWLQSTSEQVVRLIAEFKND